MRQYRWHREAKSLAPDGGPCADKSAGLLRRMPVRAAAEFRSIGKETDRRWERDDDISVLNPRLVEYRRKARDSSRIPYFGIRLGDIPFVRYSLAGAARVSEKAVKSLRRGDRIRKSTARKLERALRTLRREG